VNFGWALTQADKIIPIDGSTIRVLIDGVAVGTADYNHFRPDVAAAFPGLQNSNGAVGFRILDTTTLANGMHTIAWAVTDSGGATEGIGSRFFFVANGSASTAFGVDESPREMAAQASAIAAAPRDKAPVFGRRGWDSDAVWNVHAVGRTGGAVIRGEELQRIELWLGDVPGQSYSGFMRAGATLAPLPAGSQLNATTGWFTWAPGAGFVGTYDLVFVRWQGTQAIVRHEVRVILAAKK
jgi:hypothetical protein